MGVADGAIAPHKRIAGGEDGAWGLTAAGEEATAGVAEGEAAIAGVISFPDVSDPVALFLLGSCMFAGAGLCVYRASLVARRSERQLAMAVTA